MLKNLTFSSRMKTLFPLQYKYLFPSGLAESMTGNPRVVLGSDANVHSLKQNQQSN